MRMVTASDPSFWGHWQVLWRDALIQHPFYSPLHLHYSSAYYESSSFEPCSFLFEEGGVPLAGAILSIRTDPSGSKELSAFGRPICYLETFCARKEQIRGARLLVKQEIDRIFSEKGLDTAFLREYQPQLSFLGRCLLERGAHPKPHFTQIVSLSDSEEEMRSAMRSSYKSLINWGRRNMTLQRYDAANMPSAVFEQFRLLHKTVAGRETRSQRTWDLQYEAVRNGEAFLVLGSLQGELVTGAYFMHSPKHCYYGVSAAKRELFDKPLSHSVMWFALQEAKRLGCQWFEIGEQFFPDPLEPRVSDKEFNICKFKRGFGGETQIWLDIRWNRQATQASDVSLG